MSDRHYLINCLSLPKDVFCNAELLLLTGNSELRIHNFRQLISYCGDEIIVLCRHHKLCIRGCSLTICYYTFEEIKIIGVIDSVQFILE